MQQFKTMTVLGVETFVLLSIRPEVQAAVGQYTVNVEYYGPDGGRAFKHGFRYDARRRPKITPPRGQLQYSGAQQIMHVECAEDLVLIVDDEQPVYGSGTH